jgi:hypothetical protein
MTNYIPMNARYTSSHTLPSAGIKSTFFFVGFIIGFLILSVSGEWASSSNMFMHFGRFHTFLAPDTYFLPTAKEVQALAIAELDKSKINVVVGGSSVFYGVGQPAGKSIADDVRRELGDGYRVINLAMRGGDVSGIAEQTSEMLVRAGYKTIYVSDIGVGTSPQPIGSSPYQYFYWDARVHGFLFDWAPRDAALGPRSSLSDQAIGSDLNRWLNFNELWNYIGYRYVFTVFSNLTTHFWRRRMEAEDNEIEVPVELRYSNMEANLEIVAHISQPFQAQHWDGFRQSLKVALPPPMLRSTLLAVCENSSWLFALSPEQYLKNRVAMRSDMFKILADLGVRTVSVCDGFDKYDYVDRVHLSSDGAAKVGKMLAAEIRAMAQSAVGDNK